MRARPGVTGRCHRLPSVKVYSSVHSATPHPTTTTTVKKAAQLPALAPVAAHASMDSVCEYHHEKIIHAVALGTA